MADYYSSKLSGQRLRRCYEIAPPRVQRYLQAEIAFVLERISPSFLVLELGCGYGRVVERLAGKARRVVGIDTSRDSLRMAQEYVGLGSPCQFIQMNAAAPIMNLLVICLGWFRTQAQHGLIGPIDEQATGGGVIVCKDGFRATTVSPDEFTSLLAEYPLPPKIIEVDRSSLFCEIAVV